MIKLYLAKRSEITSHSGLGAFPLPFLSDFPGESLLLPFPGSITWQKKKKSAGSLNVAKGHVQSEVLRLSYNMRGILEPYSKTQDHFRALRVFKLCGSSVGPEGHKPRQFCHRPLTIACLVCLC